MRHLIGLEYEAVLEQRLRDIGAPHLTEGDARQSGSFKTPDALLPVPLLVCGRVMQHTPRARHTHATRTPRARHAHATRMLRARHAHATHVPCTYHAHATHVPWKT